MSSTSHAPGARCISSFHDVSSWREIRRVLPPSVWRQPQSDQLIEIMAFLSTPLNKSEWLLTTLLPASAAFRLVPDLLHLAARRLHLRSSSCRICWCAGQRTMFYIVRRLKRMGRLVEIDVVALQSAVAGSDCGTKYGGRLFRCVLFFSCGKSGNGLKRGADDPLKVAVHASRVCDHPVDLLFPLCPLEFSRTSFLLQVFLHVYERLNNRPPHAA